MNLRNPFRNPIPVLDCGDPADGRPVYFCMDCNMRRCHEHRGDQHLCRCGTCLGVGTVLREQCGTCGGTGKQIKEAAA